MDADTRHAPSSQLRGLVRAACDLLDGAVAELGYWRLHAPDWFDMHMRRDRGDRTDEDVDGSVASDDTSVRDDDLVSDVGVTRRGGWRRAVERTNLCPRVVGLAGATTVAVANLPSWGYMRTLHLAGARPDPLGFLADHRGALICLGAIGIAHFAARVTHEGSSNASDDATDAGATASPPAARKASPPVAVAHAVSASHRLTLRDIINVADDRACRFVALEVPVGIATAPPLPSDVSVPVLRMTKLVDSIPYGAHVVAVVVSATPGASGSLADDTLAGHPCYDNTLFVLVTDEAQCPWATSVLRLLDVSAAEALEALLDHRDGSRLAHWAHANPMVEQTAANESDDDLPAVVHIYSRTGSGI